MVLNEADEFLHRPSKNLKWRESYYFNWVDLKHHVSGFSTIGILPNERRREFVFLLFLKEKNEIYYKEPELEHYSDQIKSMLQSNRLSFLLIQPFKLWQISYKSRKLEFKINFSTRFPPYYFGKGSSASWHQHFEASGVIKGSLKFKNGNTIQIFGYGQRDKSWGYRDWHQFDKWYAGHFQFNDWACAFRKDYNKGQINLSGYISKKNSNIPLKRLKIDTIYEKDQFNSPIAAKYYIEDINSKEYKIEVKRFQDNSFFRFARNYSGGTTELFEQMVSIKDLDTLENGSGMMEHLRKN